MIVDQPHTGLADMQRQCLAIIGQANAFQPVSCPTRKGQRKPQAQPDCGGLGATTTVKVCEGDIANATSEVVVNAAGQWARQLGQMVGLELPIVPIEHHYLITEPVPEVAAFPGELPGLRDTQSSF